MEVGDENLPPSNHSWTSPVASCTNASFSPAFASPARSVLSDVNVSATETKGASQEMGSGTAVETEEKCTESVSADVDEEAEAWSERTAVITRYDHETNCQLARSFVEDLADKVVANNWKPIDEGVLEEAVQVSEQVEEFKVPAQPSVEKIGLKLQKQSLFLPDLVPSVVVVKPPVPPSESESDEYASADEEQAQSLHDTLYLNSTVNPSTFNASTPIDTPSWHLDFDVSTVGVADITAESTAKDTSAVVPAEEKPVESSPSLIVKEQVKEENDILIKRNFTPRPIRNQAFSPSSGSEHDVSAIESEADTLAAVTPNNPSNEVEVDLISQFERLVLNKQTPIEGFTQETQLTESEEPATVTPSLNTSISSATGLEEEVKEGKESAVDSTSSPTQAASVEKPVPIPEEQGEAIVESVQDSEEQRGKVNEEFSALPGVKVTEQEVVNEPVEALPVTERVVPQAAEAVDEDYSVTADDISLPCTDQTVIIVNEHVSVVEEPPSVVNDVSEPRFIEEQQKPQLGGGNRKALALPEEKPIVPKKGYDLSFLDRFDNLENATPSISQAKLPAITPTNNNNTLQVTDSEADRVVQEEPVLQSVDQPSEEFTEVSNSGVRATDVDTTLKLASPEVLSSSLQQDPLPVENADKGEEKADIIGKEPQEDSFSKETTDEASEEVSIIPKKGYDLSFLDKVEDIEHVSPTGAHNESKLNGSKSGSNNKMKESSTGGENPSSPSPADVQSSPIKSADGNSSGSKSSPAKKSSPNIRKPIRPKMNRSANDKSGDFEVEFAFDPNEDPFKPKTMLGSSPPRAGDLSGSPKSLTLPDANSTVCAGEDNTSGDCNDTVIESIPDSEICKSKLTTAGDDGQNQEEQFRPAEEVFPIHDPSELDYLEQHGGGSREIGLAKQSLFVKFDPLVGGRPSMFQTRHSDGATSGAHDETLQSDEKGGRKSTESLFLFSPPHGNSAGPKQSAHRAVDEPTITERVEHNQQQLNQDCLMSSRNVIGDVMSMNEHKEALKLQELLFQDRLLQKEREIQAKEVENQEMKSKLEATSEAQTQMRQIVGEYEKTISQLIAEKEREKANMESSLQNTIRERDQAIEDLKEVERAFSEFHKMYERNRTVAENLHKNEEALKKAMAAYQERLQQEQHKYETLKLHAAQKLEAAQEEMENVKRNLEGESSRVKAVLKKTEMKLLSVETTLEQKSKENEELTKLCDELINKLGSK